ncbi:MAG: radical SAM protein [Methanomassiliicoccales archaeon]|nr:radical SAM protein [Methanomassiliicoccales archaeon]
MSEKIGQTESLCPECLKTLPAEKIAENDNIYLVKTCPEHGTFKVLIWRGVEDYKDLQRYACEFSKPQKIAVENKGTCPEICGLCPDHQQHTCLAVLEITNRCNLKCPVCFASANERYNFHPTIEEIKKMYQTILDYVQHPIAVQISGGEPTIRDDLPEIVRLGKSMGIDYIEVNTNAVRLGQDIEFLKKIKEAGVDSLYFSFDGVTGDVFIKTCGRDLLEAKVKALENCKEVGMGVTLVCVVAPGINLHQVGDVIQFAKKWIPTVKGIHFQPLAYFGRYPKVPGDGDRVVLPDLLKEIERQTGGELRVDSFIPTSCANVHCDAKSMSVLMEDGTLLPLTARAMGPPRDTKQVAKKTRKEICDLWRYIEESISTSSEGDLDGTWLGFIERAKTQYLTVSAMPFQDVWNVETERLRNCCIHTVTPDGKLIPFCLFNINSVNGKTLYRHEVLAKYGNVG